MANEETIFNEALGKESPQERSAFLDHACANDATLRSRVEVLLAAHERAGSFLESPPAGVAPTTGRADRPDQTLFPSEKAGSVVGPYKLLEQIGEGGMGVVFMAEQSHPVRRRVAIKIIKPGLDSKEVIARLEAERQALAMMDHPNIAKIFDAGATETGRPYFVMELVRGIPITEYCDQHRLTPRERLELFVQVCQAVQHAHQKGIIHRDIKPSNVLVTLQDGKPTPKVIDFGVAKATAGQRLTEQTLFTEFRQLIGTPLYMSPEQAEMSALLDLDTRSDVYSLGVLLYELLTGSTPFDKQRLAKAAYDEVRRIIREEEPPRPSTRISTLGQTLTTVSAQRQTDPNKLGSIVRGELDWIVMRALEKDRTRRYETANSLARDVERYLTDQPVEACPPSRVYKLKKFTRRNKAVMTTGALIASVLVVATAVSSWQAVRARRATKAAIEAGRQVAHERDQARMEKQRAGEQAAIATAVNDFLNNDVLGQASPMKQVQSQIKSTPDRDLKVRDALDRAAGRIGTRFQGRPLVEAAIHYSIGDAYGDLGEWAKAEEHLQAALRLRRKALGDRHADTLESVHRLVVLYVDEGQYEKAQALAQEELERQRTLFGDEDRNTLSSTNLLVFAYSHSQPEKAESLGRKLLEDCHRVLGDEDPLTLRVTTNLTSAYFDTHQLDKAEPLLVKAVAMGRKTGTLNPPTLMLIANLAACYHFQGRYAEAEPLYREALKGQREVSGDWDEHTLWTLNSLAWMYKDHLQYENAEQLYEQVLERARQAFGMQRSETLASIHDLAMMYSLVGRYEDAKSLLQEALAAQRGEPDQTRLENIIGDLMYVAKAAGQTAEAAAWEKKLHAFRQIRERTAALTTRPSDPALLADRGGLYARLGEFRNAADDFNKAIEFGPENVERWHEGVPLLLQIGDESGYRRRHNEELQRFGDTMDSRTAHVVAKDSLLLPISCEELRIAAELAERGTWPSKTSLTYVLTKGMAEYRLGHIQAAIPWLLKAKADRGYFGVQSRFFMAMAFHRLGQSREAREALADAQQTIQARLPIPGKDLLAGGQYNMAQDWVQCQFLRREAEELINGNGPSTRPVATTQPVASD